MNFGFLDCSSVLKDRQVEEDEQDKTCPTLRFKEIPKDMRTVLRSCVDSESLPVLESAIVEYLRTAAEAEKTGIKVCTDESSTKCP